MQFHRQKLISGCLSLMTLASITDAVAVSSTDHGLTKRVPPGSSIVPAGPPPGPVHLTDYGDLPGSATLDDGSTPLYCYPFSWKLVRYNITDPSVDKMPASRIPLGQDGNCKAAGEVGSAPAIKDVNGKALPKIKANSYGGNNNGMVGNLNATGCTHIFEDVTMTISYCGLGHATYEQIEKSLQLLLGNCSSPGGSKATGAVWVWGVDRVLQNWLTF